jgi:DNA sulfur modification protein DndD
MILRTVTLTDFGVYGGTQVLELAPDTDGTFDRPIILFRGKNGVGKTTFVEAVRLALHGSLALGPRVSRKAYEAHLRRRIHRPVGADRGGPDEAAVEVVLDYVLGGERHTYTVRRTWRTTGVGLVESVSVLEDGEPPAHIAADDYNAFLRELVPAVAGDLFFFDGEKIDRLVDDAAADEALGGAVEQLLGLHLVSLLDTDLGVYIDRALDRVDRSASEGELAEAQALRDGLAEEVEALDERVVELQEALAATHAAIQQKEQELASEGGAYAEHYEHLKVRKRKLQVEIEATRRRIIEIAGGTLPFALAPTVLRATLRQMEAEAEFRDAQAVRDLAERQRKSVESILLDEGTYDRLGTNVAKHKRPKLVQAILDAIRPPEPDVVNPEDVYLHASDHDRAVFAAWQVEAEDPVAEAAREAATDFATMEEELGLIEEQLKLTPPDFLLRPIVEALTRLRTKREEQENALDALLAETGTARFKLEKAENRLARALDALDADEGADDKVRLARRVRRAFEAYARTLRARKVHAFAEHLLARFNDLSRKERLLDGITIDPDSFAVTLHRDGRAFGREELSAGEKQLFAVSALWALREVAEAPMPVIVDTPLGRLDSDHRLAMVRTFFPHVSHQVILLATDTEVDRVLAAEIAPAVSHGYQMVFDDETGATSAERFEVDALLAIQTEPTADGLIELDVLHSA